MDMKVLYKTNDKYTDLEIAGLAANEVSKHKVFDEYYAEKTANTRKAHQANLRIFSDWLNNEVAAKLNRPAMAGDLAEDPQAWQGITHGLIKAFKEYLLAEAYAIGTINLILSSVRVFAGLAFDAGVIAEIEYHRISRIKNCKDNQDDDREITRRVGGLGTGKPAKKADSTRISKSDRDRLRRMESQGGIHPDTPQGRRDCLLMCILLDLGLRCGEVAGLKVGNVNLETGHITVFRKKTRNEMKTTKGKQTHAMKSNLLTAMHRYFKHDAPADPDAPLLKASKKNGELADGQMKERAINARVRHFGKQIGLHTLSPHDCRHNWATIAKRNGTSIEDLKEAGGWNSYSSVDRYVAAATISNQGIILD